ncbi:uncharacterized protein LOC141889003 isoform X2 [Acropora palmata]|uniref:uncharacterized protein LOC141889003 isoform X2 n=1 Tax=Acropora palmata TaxID=6131 RepID=UPI003D9FDC06
MAFAPGFWNRRGVLTVHHNFSKRNARKNGIEKEDIIDLVKSLGAVHGVLEEPQLWAEASIVQTLIYKRSNHKKEKYFQGLKKIAKCLNRLQELRIFDKVAKINDQFPKLTEQGSLKMETISNYPSIESIICLLGYLNGAAQLLLQVLSTCKETFHQCCFHLVGGFFVTWLLTCCSSLSRIWALSRSLYNHISACYNALFPWMNYLSDPHQVKNSEAKYLPVNLLQLDKLTIGQHNQSSNALTPYETATQWTLEELFGSEKQIHEELSVGTLASEEESLKKTACDLVQSLTLDKADMSLWNSVVPSANKRFVSRKKLFSAVNSESTETPQKIADNASSIKKRKRPDNNNNEELENSTKKQKAGRKVKKSINQKSEKLSHNGTSSKRKSDDLVEDQKYKQSSFETGKHASRKVACGDEIDDIFKVLEDQEFKSSFETRKHASKNVACGDEIDDIFKVLED